MLPQSIREVLKHDGVVPIMTVGPEGPHLVATWQNYLAEEGDALVIPVGGYRVTEQNIQAGSRVTLLVGSHDVQGSYGTGAGFRLEGGATLLTDGPVFERTKERFPWCRAAMVVAVEEWEQLI